MADSIAERPSWHGNSASGTFDSGSLSLAGSPRYDSDPPSPSLRSMLTSRSVANSNLLPNSAIRRLDSSAALSAVSQVHPRRPGDSPSNHKAGSPSVASLNSRPHTPRCIHELERPGSSHGQAPPSQVDYADLGTPKAGSSVSSECPSGIFHPSRKTPIRRTGWIEPLDIDEELFSFEAARRHNAASSLQAQRPRATQLSAQSFSARTPPVAGVPRRVITRHNSPTQHTLALLNERAKLTQELARLKTPVAR